MTDWDDAQLGDQKQTNMCWNQGPELAWCLALQSAKWAAVLKNTSLVYLQKLYM